jgi:hypothetical protein
MFLIGVPLPINEVNTFLISQLLFICIDIPCDPVNDRRRKISLTDRGEHGTDICDHPSGKLCKGFGSAVIEGNL